LIHPRKRLTVLNIADFYRKSRACCGVGSDDSPQ
jgi:hypothetical protein